MINSKSFTWNGFQQHYRVSGQGRPVVLLHGFGEDGSIWNSQIEVLARQHQVIVPDIPGSGLSDFIPGASLETYVEILLCLLKELQFQDEPITLLGHSMGGYITLSFAAKYPHRLNAYGLVHSTAYADSHAKKQARKKSIEFMQLHGALAFLKTSIPGLFAPSFVKDHPEVIDQLIEKGKRFSAEALVQYYEAMMARPNRTELLNKESKPVLFIIGEEDQAVPLEASLQQCHLPNQSHIQILKGCGHMGMLESTEELNESLAQFLEYSSMLQAC